jgi:hypothetical protein
VQQLKAVVAKQEANRDAERQLAKLAISSNSLSLPHKSSPAISRAAGWAEPSRDIYCSGPLRAPNLQFPAVINRRYRNLRSPRNPRPADSKPPQGRQRIFHFVRNLARILGQYGCEGHAYEKQFESQVWKL